MSARADEGRVMRFFKFSKSMVEAAGIEPATICSQRARVPSRSESAVAAAVAAAE